MEGLELQAFNALGLCPVDALVTQRHQRELARWLIKTGWTPPKNVPVDTE